MMVNLTIQKGGIYFLGPEEEKARELRARTFLSVADMLDVTDVSETEVEGKKLVILSLLKASSPTIEELQWAKDAPVNSGFIKITDKPVAMWSDQPGRLVLLVDPETSYRDYLVRYFETPMRWVQEQPPEILTRVKQAVHQVRRQA